VLYSALWLLATKMSILKQCPHWMCELWALLLKITVRSETIYQAGWTCGTRCWYQC